MIRTMTALAFSVALLILSPLASAGTNVLFSSSDRFGDIGVEVSTELRYGLRLSIYLAGNLSSVSGNSNTIAAVGLSRELPNAVATPYTTIRFGAYYQPHYFRFAPTGTDIRGWSWDPLVAFACGLLVRSWEVTVFFETGGARVIANPEPRVNYSRSWVSGFEYLRAGIGAAF